MDITEIMNQAFNLGQTYWQQADSEYTSQQKKSDATLMKFEELSTSVRIDIHQAKLQMDELKRQRDALLEALEKILPELRGLAIFSSVAKNYVDMSEFAIKQARGEQ